MRDLLFNLATLIAATAQLLSGCLLVVGWIGGLAWVVLNGSLLIAGLWVLVGPVVVALLVSAQRLPVILLGLGIAALAGRTRDYIDFVARLND